MPYLLDPLQDNCYENSTVLINKFGIKNQNTLDEIEQTITAINSAQIELTLRFENVNFNFYKNIHKLLFYDIYDWAGNIRKVNMNKKGTSFCDFTQIETNGNNIFKYLAEQNYFLNMNRPKLINEIVDLYCRLNILHPFREGNGRTQRLFLTLLTKHIGYNLNLASIDADLLMIATIKSVSGETFLLKDIFEENLKK